MASVRRLAVAALVTSCAAFVSRPNVACKPQLRRQSTRVAPTAALPALLPHVAAAAQFGQASALAAVAAVQAAVARPTLRQLMVAPLMYALMSVNEYFTHKYYQHAEINSSPWFQWLARTFVYGPLGKKVPRTRGGGHVEHHAETLDDMTLKTDDRWRSTKVAKSLDEDLYRGTAFTWTVTGLMTFQMVFTTLPMFKLLGYSLKHTLISLVSGILVHGAVWNALHPNMHSLPDITLKHGIPSSWMAWARSSWFFKYIYTNHEGHHVIGGKGNYNVCCPLTDHLVGTFVKEADWRPKARSTYASWHGEELSVEQQIANHNARESFGLGAVQIAPGAAKGDSGGAEGWAEKAELLAA